MQRLALLMILAAVPLLCASMLVQGSDTSVDGAMRASLASGNYESAKQCFQGQWFGSSDIEPEPSCTMNGFVNSVQSSRIVAKQHNVTGRSNLIHGFSSLGHLQPVYEKLADTQLVEYSRSELAKLYFLRPVGQILNQPDRQNVSSQSEFAREWKQSAKAGEIQSAALSESAASFRASVAAGTRSGMRRPIYYQRDGDSENNCLISEDDVRPAQQYQGVVVAGGFVGTGTKDQFATEKLRASEVETLRGVESSQISSEATPVPVKGIKLRVKNGVTVK